MARYRYAGPGPREDGEGGLVRPGDVREFDAQPAWGPWEELQGGAESPPEPSPVPPPADGGSKPPAASPAAPEPPFGTESSPEGS